MKRSAVEKCLHKFDFFVELMEYGLRQYFELEVVAHYEFPFRIVKNFHGLSA